MCIRMGAKDRRGEMKDLVGYMHWIRLGVVIGLRMRPRYELVRMWPKPLEKLSVLNVNELSLISLARTMKEK